MSDIPEALPSPGVLRTAKKAVQVIVALVALIYCLQMLPPPASRLLSVQGPLASVVAVAE